MSCPQLLGPTVVNLQQTVWLFGRIYRNMAYVFLPKDRLNVLALRVYDWDQTKNDHSNRLPTGQLPDQFGPFRSPFLPVKKALPKMELPLSNFISYNWGKRTPAVANCTG